MTSLMWHFRKGKIIGTEIHQWLSGMRGYIGILVGVMEWWYIYLLVMVVTQMYAFVKLTKLYKGEFYNNTIIIIVMATEAEWALSKRAFL